jgi:hypothetical protein
MDSVKVVEVKITSTETEAEIDPFEAKVKTNLFNETNGIVSIKAVHFTTKVDATDITWKVIPGIGRDGDGVTTFPVTANEQSINSHSPRLEYEFYSYDSGTVKLQCYFSPTLNFHNDPNGLQYGISIDDEAPLIISINKDDNNQKTWEQWVSNNIIIKTTTHSINNSGKHTIKFWRVSPSVVLQKIVADFGGVKPSYLGPPETIEKYMRPPKTIMKNK